MSASKARAMGIHGRAPKQHPLFGERISFRSRDGEVWSVWCDSTGYRYAHINGCQVTNTAYGYAFDVQEALLKALEVLLKYPA